MINAYVGRSTEDLEAEYMRLHRELYARSIKDRKLGIRPVFKAKDVIPNYLVIRVKEPATRQGFTSKLGIIRKAIHVHADCCGIKTADMPIRNGIATGAPIDMKPAFNEVESLFNQLDSLIGKK